MHDGVWVAADDCEFAVRLARYCARNPVALSRLDYQSDNATVTYYSDKPTGAAVVLGSKGTSWLWEHSPQDNDSARIYSTAVEAFAAVPPYD